MLFKKWNMLYIMLYNRAGNINLNFAKSFSNSGSMLALDTKLIESQKFSMGDVFHS